MTWSYYSNEVSGFVVITSLCYVTFTMLGFMLYEFLFVGFVWWISYSSGSYERGGANYYIVFYSFCLSFMLMSSMELAMMTIVVALISFSKLPVFGLHMWLPKVHVEASMLGSIVLAGVVLKAGSIFCSIFCSEVPVLIVGVIISSIILMGADGNVVMAYSSVVHMSCCVIAFGLITIYGGYSHVVVSPLIFVIVYIGYQMSGSRILSPSFASVALSGLLLFNLGFPLLGAFYGEVIWFGILGPLVVTFLVSYFIIGIVSIRLFYNTKGLQWMPIYGAAILMIWTY